MKILQVFPGKVWGGAEQYILDLGKALIEKGHEVYFVAKNIHTITQRLCEEVKFETIPAADCLKIKTTNTFKDILSKTKPDVVHIHDTSFVFPLMTAKRALRFDTKVILTRHIARHTRTIPLFRPLYRRLHCIVFVSHLAKKYWTDVNSWMPEEKCHVVHNSIPDIRLHGEENLRKQYRIPDTTPLLVFAGRVRKSKGCETILQALAMLKEKDFAMVFIGKCKPADYGNKLMKTANEAGIAERVFIHGFTTNPRTLMAQADIGLCPSIVREACPLSAMEFMQTGVAIISTNNGGQTEYLEDKKSALLVNPANVRQLSFAISELLDNSKLRNEIGKNARNTFQKKLSYDIFATNIENIYLS